MGEKPLGQWGREQGRWLVRLLSTGLGLLLVGLTLLSWPGSLHSQAQEEARLGVWQSGGGAWTLLQQRLDRSNLPYQVMAAQQINEDGLAGLKILFLPNLGELTADQTQALINWMENQQGRLIISGPLEVDAENKSAWRALIDAYWSGELRQAEGIRLTPFADSSWASLVTDFTPIRGGSLLPAGVDSRLIAQWGESPRDPYAVIATRRSVYLGWKWGSIDQPEAAQQDQQWLQAALQYLQGLTVVNQPGGQGTPSPPPPQPINTLEALAMRQELQSLLGRVESALLVTQATQASTSSLSPQFAGVVDHARDVTSNLLKWVEAGEHVKARREFEQARADLWQNYPVDRLTALPEVRAIWLDRGTIVEAGSELGLSRVFDRLAAAGINTVFFETINAGFPIYPSRLAPEQNPLTRGWDPLAAAVKLAHERQIELHAWMWTFAVGNIRHNVLPEISRPERYIGPVLTAHPTWANLDDRQEWFPRGQVETWLDPANPEVRRYLLGLITEMIRDYGVDGIQLDYIRYPFQNASSRATFGYGQAARQQFRQLTDVDPLDVDPTQDRSLYQLWTQFRTQQINQFVGEVAQAIQKLDPHVVLSAAVYALPENERVQKLQQDWEKWIAAGDIDLLVPLTYAQNTRRLAQLVEPNLEIVRRSPTLYLPSVNLLDLPAVEFLDQMQVVRDLPTGGYALFAARQLTQELEQILSGSAISSSQIPHRNPFGAAQARFQVLQQEWQFLLNQNQIRIPEPGRSEWLAAIRQVEQDLNGLVGDPSPAQLAATQGSLATLRDGFANWMRSESLQQAYRVNTWENRLASLEMLLRYGERVLPRLVAASRTRS
ncbi:MAG: family 10 glycosylhydrolase [Cyanobacteriota bacterium]|nr:family 10 glycosylhydrolase [Cyanobacteriota bacterium]